MKNIDNIISIIMVFVTAIGFSRAVSFNYAITALVVIGAFVLYELILNAANGNPSIRTVLFVTMGFVFGLSLAVIVDFNNGWLSAVVCLLCMAYKYMVAEATAVKRSRSRNVFVIVVNAFFYASMFTVVECMAFGESTVLYVMIYVVSFAFFMCSYIAYKSMGPSRRVYSVRSSDNDEGRVGYEREHRDVGNDWRHIIKRTVNYGRQLRDQIEDMIDDSGDTFSGLIDELRKRIIPDYSDREDDDEEIRDELTGYRQQINEIANKEELTENELEILEKINKDFDEIYYDFYKEGGLSVLEYETRINGLSSDIEMLKNTINVRKEREFEDRMRKQQLNRRSEAQQARRKREREERERREREQREAEERANEQEKEDEADRERSAEEERQRREEEKKRQEKRRRERNRRTTSEDSRSGAKGSTGSGNKQDSGEKDDGSSKVAGIKTKYFKGCTTVDELSLRYKKLCLIYHPDSGNGDVDTYIELKDEYELLKKRLS